ncbi:RNA-directed DNA polymerase, eukaryota, reverse transcriptase zinc-binding domain protein [Tanacetum coccineum]
MWPSPFSKEVILMYLNLLIDHAKNENPKTESIPKPEANPNFPYHQSHTTKPLYDDVIHNKQKPTITSHAPDIVRTISLIDNDLITIEDPSTVLLLKLNEADTLSNMYAICKSEECQHEKPIFLPSFKVDERMIWIEISGLPFCAWGSNAYKKVASLFCKFKFFEDEESTAMSLGKVFISTRSYKQVSETIKVEVNREIFDIYVHEIGTWNINIDDNTSDSSSHSDVNHLDKKDISVEDKLDDDLDDLNGMLNNLNQATKKEETPFESPYDINTDEPLKQEEYEICKQPDEEFIKVSESSDLSRPPGFENTKRSSSNNSKYSTNFARHQSMARGRSGGLISMWDPNMFSKDTIWCDDHFIIVKGHWNNAVGDCFMINIYGPQESSAKSHLWNRIADFMNEHNGKFILFGDMNTVWHENERSGSLFSRIKADHFNTFIDSTSLIDLPMGGRYFTWMNKAGTKLNKLDRFLISEGIIEYIPDIIITAIDRMWSDHSPILLHAEVRKNDKSQKRVILSEIKDIEKKIDDGSASTFDRGKRITLLQNIDKLDNLEALDLIQKPHIKWDIEGSLPQGANSSFFMLIPKISNPISIKDFRPISLIGTHYKIIAKILANHLSKVIDKVVSKEHLNFGSKWRSWIRACLRSSRSSILINGNPTSEFSIKRGLRQGDPLSLFLFILVMEGLHCALSNTVSSGLIRVIKLGSSDITLSHLFYADDVVITTDWNSRDIDNIIRVLHVFYLASGLRINIHKSNIYGIGVSNNEISSLASRTGCAAGFFPFTYLGLPIGANMNLSSSWNILIDRFQKRLSSRKANLLSIGGRLTLIKAVLGSLGIYYLSIFKAPESILNTLESLRSKFFWGGSQDSKNMAWVKWSYVLPSFDKGGLNIGSLKNLALLQKWRWRMFSSSNTLWVNTIKALHGQDGGLDNQGCNFNGIWSRIVCTSIFLHSKDIIPLNSFRFKIRSRQRLLNHRPYCRRTLEIGIQNTAYLRDLLIEISQVDISVDEDTCTWSLADDGIFSVRSSRHLIDSKLLPFIFPSTSWDNILPRKVNIFLWRLTLDRLPQRLNLSSRGIDILTISCSSCNGNVESADHIFFACDLAKDVWSLVRKWCDLSSPSFASYVGAKCRVIGLNGRKILCCLWDHDDRFLVVQAFVFYLEL